MITDITFKPTFWQKVKMKFCRHKLEDVSCQGYVVGIAPVKYFCTKCGVKKLGTIFSRYYLDCNLVRYYRREWAEKYQLNK